MGIMVKEIQLTQGKVALVDDSDYDYLNQWKWFAYQDHNSWYARRTENNNGKSITILMHSLLLNTPKGMLPDHKDGNGLNNQRHNLRVCTYSENQHNKRMTPRNKTSKFKGVHWVNRDKRWRAQIHPPNHLNDIYLGQFVSEIQAAKVYDDAAKKYFGEFACTNFKEGGTQQ